MRFHSHQSIGDIRREDWESLFPGQAENWDYYRAIEGVPPEGFAVAYLSVVDNGAVVAAAPVFHTRHHLHASLTGGVRRLLDRLAEKFPRAMSLGITGWGSPLVDRCHIGFHPSLPAERRREAFQQLYEGLEAQAAEKRSVLLVAKDVDQAMSETIDDWMRDRGFGRMRSLPNVYLDLPFEDWNGFLASHSRRVSGYLKRKEKQAAGLTVSSVNALDAATANRIYELYEGTRQTAAGDYGGFEDLDPEIFEKTAAAAPKANVNFLVATFEGRIVGALMFIRGSTETVWTFVGMEYPIARDLNIYFVLLNHLIRDCIATGRLRLRMGNTSYGPKLLYGGKLETHWVYIKHRSKAINPAFRRLVPKFDYELNDPELRALRENENKSDTA